MTFQNVKITNSAISKDSSTVFEVIFITSKQLYHIHIYLDFDSRDDFVDNKMTIVYSFLLTQKKQSNESSKNTYYLTAYEQPN